MTGGAFTPPDPQQTNAAQLYTQVNGANEGNPNVVVDYIRGVGTNGTFDMSAAFADARVEENAQQAYAQFADAAAAWLDKNPGGSVTTAITAFSRGGPTGIRFAQLLNEKGLTLSDGTVMQISVSAMALIDPVGTTVADGKSVIPPNVNRDNFIVVGADNEYRYAFMRENYNAGENNFGFFGNHCDVGGCFGGGGIGELVLGGKNGSGGLTGFLRNVGLSIADVPSTRMYSADAPQYVNDSSRDSSGNEKWSAYGVFNPNGTSPQRLLDNISTTDRTEVPPVFRLPKGGFHATSFSCCC